MFSLPKRLLSWALLICPTWLARENPVATFRRCKNEIVARLQPRRGGWAGATRGYGVVRSGFDAVAGAAHRQTSWRFDRILPEVAGVLWKEEPLLPGAVLAAPSIIPGPNRLVFQFGISR